MDEIPQEIGYKFKIWLIKDDDDYLIGGGSAKLLDAIDESRDLGKAGEMIGISYKKAWNLLQKIKKNIGSSPVITHRGGKGGGGGIELSNTGKNLLLSYKKFKKFMENAYEDFLKSELKTKNIHTRDE